MTSSYEKQITNIRFNQDKSEFVLFIYCLFLSIVFGEMQQMCMNSYFASGCFMCCMDNGLRIYYIEPLVEKVHYGKFNISCLSLFNYGRLRAHVP